MTVPFTPSPWNPGTPLDHPVPSAPELAQTDSTLPNAAAPNTAIPSATSHAHRRRALQQAMNTSRAMTLQLFDAIDAQVFCAQAHHDFSPVGWHLGHIGYTESLWILEHLAGQPCRYPEYRQLFAADGLPKRARQQLPDQGTIRAYLQDIREQVDAYLATADLDATERLWQFLLQHESQHCETIALVLATLGELSVHGEITSHHARRDRGDWPQTMCHIPAGGFWQGHDGRESLDNEQPQHWVELGDYWIDAAPVTDAEYQEFIAAGGYSTQKWWSEVGWAWQQTQQLTQPHYWQPTWATSNHPVCGVSWYEADAYARFVGKRLPTEAEWEKAVRWDGQTSRQFAWGDRWRTQDTTQLFQQPDATAAPVANLSGLATGQSLRGTTPIDGCPAGRSASGLWDGLGNVWEWTNSWFEGYPGFTAFPYHGYSAAYFDGEHRVLRGGSWATRPWSIRSGFRNWYHPWTRIIFAGFRCARDTAP